MPVNGAAACLPFPEPTLPEVVAKEDQPAGAPITLGEEVAAAVASATTALCYALHEFQTSGLCPETRRAIGERTAKVAMLQLELGDRDFAVHARGAKRILRRHLDADYFRRHTSAQADEAIDMFVSELLGVVDRVVADERAPAVKLVQRDVRSAYTHRHRDMR